MINWQTPEIYNKIGVYLNGVNIRRMPVSSTEIERLYTLDPHEITAIHDKYYPEIFRFARFRLSDATVAEDIASEVFMRLLEAVQRGQGPKTNLKMWLIRTASNIINDHYRKIYQRPHDEPVENFENQTDLFVMQSDPVEVSEQEETKRMIRDAMNQLTEMQQMVITLRFANRYSLEETGRMMGKEINTIKALQFRALEALRRILGERL